ncbi:unnamed protein product [Candidula unifasciata]|uniref:Uncharacterized protein n=1 Tax=Candidula unifasciata TaxID=100452 RepID=A0A8S3YJ29_9EUPU|nr:unnamed protein product [Candidula unifasciata]
MVRQKYDLIIWIRVCAFTCSFAAGCPYQECSCDGYEISCQDLGLPAIPRLTGASSGFDSLLLGSNHITTIPAGSLPSGLLSLSLLDNPIATIDENAFNGSATTLRSLSISRANFSRIPDAFGHLQNLKYFDFYDTNIVNWNDDVMKKLGQTMINLDLEKVGLKMWPHWLNNYSSLNDLTVDFNQISSLPDDALNKMIFNLTGLSISNASLTSVPRAISKLVNLESLHLYANKISNLTWLPPPKKLTTLSLNNNLISDAKHLSDMLRPFNETLASLEIDRNMLTAIPDFSFLNQVSSLDFSFNRISDPTSGALSNELYDFDLSNNCLPSIPTVWRSLVSSTSMYLSHNLISHIEQADFHEFLMEINLSFNMLTELTDSSFPAHTKLFALYLNNNPIATISNHAFDGLDSLNTLNLQHTRLTRMPLALTSVLTLYTLDMSDSSDLVCTCAEKSLETWIMTVKQVNGQCGETDINEFFATLSPMCPP